jgi:hypothetical protein
MCLGSALFVGCVVWVYLRFLIQVFLVSVTGGKEGKVSLPVGLRPLLAENSPLDCFPGARSPLFDPLPILSRGPSARRRTGERLRGRSEYSVTLLKGKGDMKYVTLLKVKGDMKYVTLLKVKRGIT